MRPTCTACCRSVQRVLVKFQGAEGYRRQARQMEANASRFYHQAASRTLDATIRNVLGDLAVAEAAHEQTATQIDEAAPPTGGRVKEDEDTRRRFVLQIVQPGLVGLMDGSVSTLAPVFAAAFATHISWNAFLVGLAASVGAGVSMGFAEALADDGKLSGRGTPYLRGLVCGLMTTAGGIGHTLPYLIPDFWTATGVAGVVVVFELLTIAWIQWRYMDTPPVSAAAKVMLARRHRPGTRHPDRKQLIRTRLEASSSPWRRQARTGTSDIAALGAHSPARPRQVGQNYRGPKERWIPMLAIQPWTNPPADDLGPGFPIHVGCAKREATISLHG